MKRLHDFLGDLTNTAADIENLRIVLKKMEQANDMEEAELLRATLNLAILTLSKLKSDIDNSINVLDGFLLEQWHKNPSSLPKGI